MDQPTSVINGIPDYLWGFKAGQAVLVPVDANPSGSTGYGRTSVAPIMYGTLLQMWALVGEVPIGTAFHTTDSFTINGVVIPIGNDWIYDGVQWRPRGFQRVSVDNRVLTGTQTTGEQIVKQLTAAAGLLYKQRWRLEVSWGKNGTTDILNQVNVRVGSAGLITDSNLTNSSATNLLLAAKTSVGTSSTFDFVNSTTVFRVGSAGTIDQGDFLGMVGVNPLQNQHTTADMLASANIFSLTANMATAAANSPQVGDVYLTLEP